LIEKVVKKKLSRSHWWTSRSEQLEKRSGRKKFR